MTRPEAITPQALQALRSSPESWVDLAYLADDNDDTIDVHGQQRESVLWAILPDPLPTDRPLLRFLVHQDIREAEGAWGVSEALYLSTFLLAEHRCVDDAWLLWDAKWANVDTAIGLEWWPVLAGGVQAVREAALTSSHPRREQLLADLAEEPCATATDEAIHQWLTRTRAAYLKALKDS